MYNNFNNGFYNQQQGFQQPYYGAGFNQVPYATRFKPNQPLTQEEQKELINARKNIFTIGLKREDLLSAKCTHKDPVTGEFTLESVIDSDGIERKRCAICGAIFEPAENTKEEVQYITEKMVDILQTIKTVYMDIPTPVAEEFMKVIPLLNKVPDLYGMAMDSYARQGGNIAGGNRRENTGFGLLGGLLTAPSGYGFNQYGGPQQFGGYNMPYQQPYQPQYQQPFQQPMQQPGFGMGMNQYQQPPYQPNMNNMQQPGMNQQQFQQQQGSPFYDPNAQMSNMQQQHQNQPAMNQQNPPKQEVPKSTGDPSLDPAKVTNVMGV